MFDNMEIRKSFKIQDNITGHEIEIATFNAVLMKGGSYHQNMNIAYPVLYENNKEAILESYRQFNAEVSALAVTMGLADKVKGVSTLEELQPLHEEIKEMTTKIMTEVIQELGNIQVNPVPTMDVGYNTPHMMYR